MHELSISKPTYYHREYKNDITEPKEECSPWIHQSQRVAKVALPFVSLYQPLSRPLSLALGSLRSYSSITELMSEISKGNTKDIPYHLLQTTIAVLSLAGTLFAHPLGMMLTTGHDLVVELISLHAHCQAGDYAKALESSANILNNSLYLALFLHGGLELTIASFAMQILLGLYHSRNEFKNGNYLEGTGHLLMALIRSHQMAGQAQLLKQQWEEEKRAKMITKRAMIEHSQKLAELSSSDIERRAVIDVGSGSTKFCIADVDIKTQSVVKIILNESYAVPYQASLEASDDYTFSREVRETGIQTFTKINALCEEHNVQKVTAVATEAFRKSMNGESFAKEIYDRTCIPLRIITQKEEGAIAYYSAASLVKDRPQEDLIVWDIGTGSYQITMENKDKELSVFMGNVGSVPFKNYIIDVVQNQDSSSPSATLHPFTEEDHIAADRYARALARQAFPNIKHQISEKDGKVVGVGRLFTNSLLPFSEDPEKITRADLRKYITSCYGKTKEDLNNPFSEADLANATLALGFMKALHIQEIHALSAATSQGMLTYAPYWEEKQVYIA
jgi:exopolyphosphatase/guanosine-5'-triphosphate,3'-diphosphate pyrophosphatase